MLSSDDYVDFCFGTDDYKGLYDILDECFVGVDLDKIPDNASLA